MPKTTRASIIAEWILLTVLSFVVLWKGGKSLESTWLLGGVAVALTFLSPRGIRVSRSAFLAGITFLLLSVVSQLFSTAANYGLDEIIRDTACFLVFLWVARVVASEGTERFAYRFAQIFTASVLAACIIGVGVYALQPVSRFVGTFFDARFHTDYWPNAWAELLLLAWPMAVYALRRRPLVLGFALGAFLGSLLLSYSRAGFLALLAQLMLLALVGAIPAARARTWPKGECVLHWGKVAALTIASAVLFFFAGNALRARQFAVESVVNKVTFNAAEGTSSVSERREFWSAALSMTKERPLFGWGPYSFRFVQPRYQSSVLATSDHPHNVFLKVAAERGLPALVAFVSLLCVILLPRFLSSLRRRKAADASLWRPLALVAVIGVLTHTLVDYNLQFVGIALPFWIVLGTLASSKSVKREKQSVTTILIAAVLLAVLLFEGVFLVTSSLARRAHDIGDDDSAILWYERSSLQIFRRDSDLALADIHVNREEVQEARADLRKAIALNPNDARAWLMLGNLQESEKEWETALAAYERTWELGRYNILNALSGMVRVYVTRVNNAQLKEHREEFLRLFEAYANAILRNTHFIALGGTVDELEHVSGYLQRAYPADAAIIRGLTTEALEHAEEEQSRYDERKAGLLW